MPPIDLDSGTTIEAGDTWTIALNRNQNLLGKCMIVLNRDASDVTQLSEVEWTELLLQMARVKQALATLFRPDHINYLFLMNQDAQVHLHVLPRYAAARIWEGQTFEDPDYGSMSRADSRPLDVGSLSQLASDIGAALN